MKRIYLLITFIVICFLASCGGEEIPTTSPTVVPTTNVPTVVPTTTPTPSKHAPVLSDDGKSVFYGYYPQSKVNDDNLIQTLNTLSPEANGWYYLNETYYVKQVANVYNNELYTFDDGSKVVNGTTYWFECESIEWIILNKSGNTYTLMSKLLLDNQNFYNDYSSRTIDGKEVYANNYEYSDIRTWLNGYFLNTAFALDNSYLLSTTLDNSANQTDSADNKYACENTQDKVFLPSYQDVLNSEYGFDSTNGVSVTRQAKTSDYVRAIGSWSNNRDSGLIQNGTYWTRSATSEYFYCAWNVNSSGNLSTYAVDGESHSVRPCITINME